MWAKFNFQTKRNSHIYIITKQNEKEPYDRDKVHHRGIIFKSDQLNVAKNKTMLMYQKSTQKCTFNAGFYLIHFIMNCDKISCLKFVYFIRLQEESRGICRTKQTNSGSGITSREIYLQQQHRTQKHNPQWEVRRSELSTI